MKVATLTESSGKVQREYRATDLEVLFRQVFYPHYRTRLQGGVDEPLYTPPRDGGDAVIYYREDFFRSALHEVAHWCVAGPERRQQEDFGYWYAPDGRDAQQQQAFMQVEIWPQALEKLFCDAAGVPFRVSLDNLAGAGGDERDFEAAVLERADALRQRPGKRAALWLHALSAFYGGA